MEPAEGNLLCMNASDRKKLLDMACVRAKPGSGSAWWTVHEATGRYCVNPSFLPDLEPIRFVVVGGLATARYMPERMTLDTDILIAASDLAAVEDKLNAQSARKQGPLSVGGSTWHMKDGRILDVLAMEQEWVAEAIHGAERDENGVPIAALPHLVLMKLESGRLQDLADISRMLGFASDPEIEATRRVVGRFRPRDIEDLQSMIRLGKLEWDRMT